MMWALIGLLVVVALGALLRPLLKKPAEAASRADYDLNIFQDQLKEVDRDVERGVLTASEADAARLEIQRRILTAEKIPEAAQAPGGRWRLATVGVVAIAVPLFAGLIYLKIGTPFPGAAQTAQSSDEIEIEKMVQKLAEGVAKNPNNIEDVRLLARSYTQMGRFADAVPQYKQVLALEPSAENFASYGEALVFGEKGQVGKEAHESFIKSLTLDRGEPRAQFYLGLEQLDKNQPKNAIAIWRSLMAAAPADAPWLTMVKEQLASAAQTANIPPISVEPKYALDFMTPEETALARLEAAAPPSAVAARPPAAGKDSGPMGQMSPEMVDTVKGMVAGLAARLEANPDDYAGWLMLGRSDTVLKDYAGAKKAYDKAIALKPTDVEPRMQYLAALMTTVDPTDPGPLPKNVVEAADSVLKLNPKQPEALYVSGLARVKLGDGPGARALWTQAKEAMPADSPLKADLEQHLKALQ